MAKLGSRVEAGQVVHAKGCPECGGDGRIPRSVIPWDEVSFRCEECSGSGELTTEGCDCSLCGLVRDELQTHVRHA